MNSSLHSIIVFIAIILLPRPSTAEADDNPVVDGFPPYILVYKNGTIFRNFTFPTVPPSPVDPLTGVSSKDINITSELQARIFLPKLKTVAADYENKLPIFIWFHGGGFFAGTAFSAEEFPFHNMMASRAGAIVISVDYQLVPEHRLPAAYNDCWAAIRWVTAHRNHHTSSGSNEPWLVKYGDFDRVFIGGGSAGGNIVHNMLMRAGLQRENMVKILGAIETHPYFWGSNETDTDPKSLWFFNKVWSLGYPTAPGGIDNPMVNPFSKNAPSLTALGCSKLFVSVAELDPLRNIGVRYYNAVKSSGWDGEAKLLEIKGVGHSFFLENLYSKEAQYLIRAMVSFIRKKKHHEIQGKTMPLIYI